MVAIVIGASLLAWLLWPWGLRGQQRPSASGGLGLFVEAARPGTPGDDDPISLDATVEVRSTSFEGYSLLVVDLRFQNPRPHLRWHVVATGQYASSEDMPLLLFCDPPNTARSVAQGVECDDQGGGSVDVRYRFGERLGAILPGDQVHAPSDSDLSASGNDESVSVSGTLRPAVLGERALIWIPIRTPKVARSGDTQHIALAGVSEQLVTNRGFENDPTREPAWMPENRSVIHAALPSGIPLEALAPTTLRFTYAGERGPGRVDWANPATDTPNALTWSTESGSGLGGFQFAIRDPFKEGSLARRTFFAGVAVSIGATALLVLVERLLDGWVRRRSMGSGSDTSST